MIAWAIEALIASTVLMLVVLVLRVPVRRAFGAEIAYALWLLPVLRLVMPPLPEVWQASAVAPVLRATGPVTVLFVESVDTAVAPTVPVLGPVLTALWVAGAAAFLAWHSLAHVRFCRRMLAAAETSAECDGVRLIETAAARGPLAFGIWRRYIAFPRDFSERFEPEERDLALAHELGHHARGDLIANWIALVVLAVHWFNPLAWRAFRAFRADQEIANDARVLAGMNPMRRHAYACAILKAAHGGAISAACHLHTIDDLKGRLRMLTTTKTSRLRLMTGAAAVSLLALVGLGLTASGTAAAAKVRRSVATATGVDLAAIDQAVSAAPAAPVPPVPPTPPATRAPATTALIAQSVDGKGNRRVIRTLGDANGSKTKSEDMAALQNMIEVGTTNCETTGDLRSVVVSRNEAGKKIITICSNRIKIMAEKGAALAANSNDIERKAYSSALAGLRGARTQILASEMSADARKHALEGIDTAIAEIEGDLAKVN